MRRLHLHCLQNIVLVCRAERVKRGRAQTKTLNSGRYSTWNTGRATHEGPLAHAIKAMAQFSLCICQVWSGYLLTWAFDFWLYAKALFCVARYHHYIIRDDNTIKVPLQLTNSLTNMFTRKQYLGSGEWRNIRGLVKEEYLMINLG